MITLRVVLDVVSHPATWPFSKAVNTDWPGVLCERSVSDATAAPRAWGKTKQLDDVVTWVVGAPQPEQAKAKTG
jgi:hypothetical protein